MFRGLPKVLRLNQTTTPMIERCSEDVHVNWPHTNVVVTLPIRNEQSL